MSGRLVGHIGFTNVSQLQKHLLYIIVFAGPQQNSSLVNSSQPTSFPPSLWMAQITVSKSWATTRSHWNLLQLEGASEGRKASSAQNCAKALARGPNPHEAAHGQVGGVGRGVTRPKGIGLSDPSVFSMNPPGHTSATHTTPATTSYCSWSPLLPVKLEWV